MSLYESYGCASFPNLESNNQHQSQGEKLRKHSRNLQASLGGCRPCPPATADAAFERFPGGPLALGDFASESYRGPRAPWARHVRCCPSVPGVIPVCPKSCQERSWPSRVPGLATPRRPERMNDGQVPDPRSQGPLCNGDAGTARSLSPPLTRRWCREGPSHGQRWEGPYPDSPLQPEGLGYFGRCPARLACLPLSVTLRLAGPGLGWPWGDGRWLVSGLTPPISLPASHHLS